MAVVKEMVSSLKVLIPTMTGVAMAVDEIKTMMMATTKKSHLSIDPTGSTVEVCLVVSLNNVGLFLFKNQAIKTAALTAMLRNITMLPDNPSAEDTTAFKKAVANALLLTRESIKNILRARICLQLYSLHLFAVAQILFSILALRMHMAHLFTDNNNDEHQDDKVVAAVFAANNETVSASYYILSSTQPFFFDYRR
jgi:hypothetical protein